MKMSKRFDDTDIVDVLHGDASAEVRERVRAKAEENRAYAERYSEWEQIVGAARTEKKNLDEMSGRVAERVMSNLRFVEVPAKARRNRIPRFAVASAICSMAVVVALIVQFGPSTLRVSEGPETASGGSSSETGQVIQVVESVSDLWALQKVIDAVPEGGKVSIGEARIEGNFIFAKPMTIVSHDGLIVIGRI